MVEVTLDSVHHVVADHALVAEPDDSAALGLEQLAHQPLPSARPVLVAIVLDLAGLGLEAPVTAVVGSPEPLHGIVAGPVLGGQLLQPLQRRIRRDQTPRSSSRSSQPSPCTSKRRMSTGRVRP
jgi:hypothetical protein